MNFDLHYFLELVFSPPPQLIYAVWLTVSVTLTSMAVGIIAGLFLALFGLSLYGALRGFNWLYVWFFRGTPILVQLFLIYFGLPYLIGVDIFPSTITTPAFSISGAIVAGIFAFSLHEAAYMSEITRAGIRSVEKGQSEAAQALGMLPSLAMRRIILPQALRIILPSLGNQCNMMFKTTAFLSVIAVPELVHVADSLRSQNFKTFEVYAAISVYYLVLTGVWTVLQQWIENRLSWSPRTAAREPESNAPNLLQMET
ncbi:MULTISPECIES: amino acid ABC transporter permease [Rhizobium/Agrobacterium group]|uniref:Glutamate/aspartate import permease protein GltK n=4 Tax=Rhizobium/Agrobacterium group TaxID=227290 RepID=A8VZS3_RHIRH|nr:MULTISPECIES: amino acid ABC transporter permease [Rhizobium/Agrobacterium group]ABW33562.1 rcorf5 [Rhizobium rhizogenes]AQS65529.1 amino acid ABC transporter permease [Rhizobium rhizogenes]ASK42045.1 polar amino acid ABC transporter permease [Rhizobium rhizogenes]MCZ7445921.1 amino acid ABC transporter permease [Rhizobium rhizogenes]MCZ7472656.1 amino acid ABC transporter permease [Rhizobium rhizogenes]